MVHGIHSMDLYRQIPYGKSHCYHVIPLMASLNTTSPNVAPMSASSLPPHIVVPTTLDLPPGALPLVMKTCILLDPTTGVIGRSMTHIDFTLPKFSRVNDPSQCDGGFSPQYVVHSYWVHITKEIFKTAPSVM
jgi:hypothetical protein